MPEFLKSFRNLPQWVRIPLIYGVIACSYIVVSGAVLQGPFDYAPAIFIIETTKGLIFVLVTSIILWAILWRADLSSERQVQYELQRQGRLFNLIAENIRETLWVLDADTGEIVYTNASNNEICGYPLASIITEAEFQPAAIHPEDRKSVAAARGIQHNKEIDIQYRIIHPGGEISWVREKSLPVPARSGENNRIIGVTEKITDLKIQQAAQEQARRLETIVSLTSGITHDFNNFLLVIQSNAEVLLEQQQGDQRVERQLQDIVDACEGAGQLTHRLMAFSREQQLTNQTLQARNVLDAVVAHTDERIGNVVECEVCVPDDTWLFRADRALLENCLLELIDNALGAMSEGDVLTLRADNVKVNEQSAQELLDLLPGDYVRLDVEDTGSGMTDVILARAFDPFFSAYGDGKRTGLGLSMAYGFAKQSWGIVTLQSQPGQGTVVSIYLPRAHDTSS